MKVLPDGYKVIEDNDPAHVAIYGMKDNIDLLHKRIAALESQKTEGQNEGRSD